MSNYYASLPTKRMAACALVRDEQGRILIVKPTYRPDWLLPGGTIEADESPRHACSRELYEEVGVRIPVGRLLCVDYTSVDGEKTESLQFIFDGGVFSEQQIAQLKLPADELSECRFVDLAEAQALVHPKISRRLPHALAALSNHSGLYLEDGALSEAFDPDQA
ncbi:ADP-ribose pyrophosphatase [Anaerolineae bacterium]|nr:ADP-ribose pyrophosphatase [Anaerolineae bacterium]